jgi:hypothetical protein
MTNDQSANDPSRRATRLVQTLGFEQNRGNMEPSNPLAELTAEIRAAFPTTPVPNSIVSDELLYDPERKEVVDCFSGRIWADLSVDELRYHDIAMSCFTPAAFAYYLPAYLLAILRDFVEADILVHGTFHYLRPISGFIDMRNERRAALSPRQRKAVVLFAEYMRTAYGAMFNHDEPWDVAEFFRD